MAKQSTDSYSDYAEDERLLRALQSRIDDGATRLYERGYNYSVPKLFKMGSSWEDAEDAFQEGIVAFLMNIHKIMLYVGLIIQLDRYVRNKWIDGYRKYRTYEKHLKEMPLPDPQQDLLDAEMQEQIRWVRTQLEPESQRLLELLIDEQKKPQEVAEILGWSIDSVYNQKSRCIKYVRNLIMLAQS